jgi:hypothetical protein
MPSINIQRVTIIIQSLYYSICKVQRAYDKQAIIAMNAMIMMMMMMMMIIIIIITTTTILATGIDKSYI